MRTELRRMGNSSGVIIPKPVLEQIGVKTGDALDMSVEAGRVVIAPVKRKMREGWAESAAALAALGEDALVWPEFGNEGDEKLNW